jgi:hypothetical protein
MGDRIHLFLDGEIPREALTPEERAQLREYERTIDAVRDAIPTESGVDLAPAVMARIEAWEGSGASASTGSAEHSGVRPAGRGGGLWRWLWSPRSIRVQLRPAYGVAMAFLVAGLLVGDRVSAPPSQTAASEGAAAEAQADAGPMVLVQFRVEAPDARSVALAGDFSQWRPDHHLHEVAEGVWVAVVALPPGVHDYAFVVDGEHWVADPLAAQVADGFGGVNSRIALPASPTGVSS